MLLNKPQILPRAPCLPLSVAWPSKVILFVLLEKFKLEFTSLSVHGDASALRLGMCSYVYLTVLRWAEH